MVGLALALDLKLSHDFAFISPTQRQMERVWTGGVEEHLVDIQKHVQTTPHYHCELQTTPHKFVTAFSDGRVSVRCDPQKGKVHPDV